MSGYVNLKITFDETRAGEALVRVAGRRCKRRAPGQWVVFDRNGSRGCAVLFASGDIEDCHAWILSQEIPADGLCVPGS